MKKYQLIKELPFENSPKIGYISKPKEGELHYYNHNWFKPKDYPEFWEEVVDNNPLKLEVGKTYKIQYKHCPNSIQTVTITRFTKQGFPWSDDIKGIITGYYNLIEEVKQPILTTEDGFDIFDENEKLWFVNPTNDIIPTKGSDRHNFKRFKYFLKKEAAEEYILMNKPCLSINDLEDLNINCAGGISFSRVDAKELVKSKL